MRWQVKRRSLVGQSPPENRRVDGDDQRFETGGFRTPDQLDCGWTAQLDHTVNQSAREAENLCTARDTHYRSL